jgi:tellurite resistance protein
MVSISAVDREMTDLEMRLIGHLVQTLPVFSGFHADDLIKVSQACSRVLARPDGLNAILNEVAARLPKKLHELAYALVVEIANVDGAVDFEEGRLLELLRKALKIEPLAAAAIEHSARIRQQKL